MVKRTSLDVLIDLATDQRDAATTALGQLRVAHQQSEQQLEALLAYRSEYQRQLDTALGRGMSMTTLNNYQRFVTSLDQAIEQQRGVLATSQDQVNDGKSHWQHRQRRLKSFDALALRRRESAQHKEARREQRQTDEYASRAQSTLSGF